MVLFMLPFIKNIIRKVSGRGSVKKRRGRRGRRNIKLSGKGFYNQQLTNELYRKFGNKGTRKKVSMNFRSIGGRGRGWSKKQPKGRRR